jgi:DNA-binding transcriptional ArsR family regulator
MQDMISANTIAEVAALIGDPARANILSALMGGPALTAGELAWHAGVTSQTTSGHLSKLADAKLVALEKQGRHRYYRLASPEIAYAMEALMAVATNGPKRYRPIGPRDEAMRTARTCYDHLAGRLAIAIADSLSERRHLILSDGAGVVTEKGRRFLHELGVELEPGAPTKRPLCRTCIDWSERRPHLAGRLGAALLQRLFDLHWVVRRPGTRSLRITGAGHRGLYEHFRIAQDL